MTTILNIRRFCASAALLGGLSLLTSPVQAQSSYDAQIVQGVTNMHSQDRLQSHQSSAAHESAKDVSSTQPPGTSTAQPEGSTPDGPGRIGRGKIAFRQHYRHRHSSTTGAAPGTSSLSNR